MADNYDDIINTKWPLERSERSEESGGPLRSGGSGGDVFRERMDLENRAKIFLPFAALTGFEKEINMADLAARTKDDK